MKVYLFTDNLGSGGAQRQLVGLAIMLANKHFDVKVCTYYSHDFYKDQLDKNGVQNEIICCASNKIKRIFKIFMYFKREHPDCVIAYQETPSIIASVAKLFGCKYKLIVSERNTTQTINWMAKFRFHLFRLADFVVPNAYAQEEFIQKSFSFLNKKILTIPNYVDLDFFYPLSKRLRKDIPEIIVVASIFAPKNTLGFLDAVDEMKKRNLRFHISWYGKVESHIDYFNQCQEKINKMGLEDVIELKAKTVRIRDFYQNADFFCLPSFYEGTPNVICEAMACGLPILCSDVCDNPLYVVAGENGFLFNPYDKFSIADKFERAISLTEEQYLLYCEVSRKKAEEKFSKDIFIRSYIKLIEQ